MSNTATCSYHRDKYLVKYGLKINVTHCILLFYNDQSDLLF